MRKLSTPACSPVETRRASRPMPPRLAGEPLALGVITATGYGYMREDGIAVIPIGALGP